MDKTEILRIVDSMIGSCESDSELLKQQADAMDYYHGKPYGDEEPGQSSIVTRDLLDTVEWLMPSLMRIFASNDKTVAFDPTDADDEQQAKQETDYVNYVFNKENDGYMILHNWMKSALLQKNAYVKVWVEEDSEVETQTYTGLTELDLAQVLGQDGAEPVQSEAYLDESGQELFDVKVQVSSKQKKVKVCSVPQEDIGVLDKHDKLSLKDAPFVYHKSHKTVSDLIEMGFDRKLVESLPSHDDHLETDLEISRDYMGISEGEDYADESMREVLIYECYCRMDMDDTGIAKLYKITKGGNEIIDIEEADFIPFATLSPIPMPHEHHGLSEADLVMDIQRIRSVVMRQMLNNLYLTNNPEREVLESKVNMQDLMTSHAGALKRVKQMGSIREITVPFTAGQSMPMLEILDTLKENRTGVSRTTMGLDANTLAKSTEGAFMGAMEQANQRVEMLARTFAETGVKELFLMMHELLIKHYDKQQVIAMNGEYIPVSPTEWKNRHNMSVMVGLGTGNKDRRLQQIFSLIEKMEKHMEMGTTLVSPMNIYNAYSDLLEEAGFTGVNRYLIDPNSPEGQQMAQQKAQQAQAPNPQVMAVQMQGQIEQGKQRLQEAKQQSEQMKSQADAQIKMKEMQLRERELALKEKEMQLKLEIQANETVNKMAMHNDEIAVKLTDIEAKTATQQDQNYQENKLLND